MAVTASTRASTLVIKKEVTEGTYIAPASGSDFVPLRPGSELKYEPEKLENDELINDIGAAKAFTGKEKVSGSHKAYLKHSGVEGQEPEVGVLYESIMGSKSVAAAEYVTIAGCTKTLIKVGAGVGANFVVGQPLLIKNGAGYEIRNIKSISVDDLSLDFQLTNIPGVGVALGKAVTYIPVATGHPTFSTTKYIGGGFAKEVSAGNTCVSADFTMDANGFGEVDFKFEGVKYYFNPITITASNKFLDVTDDTGTFAVEIAEGIYKTPVELADAISAALDAASTETYTVTFSSSTGKFTIASGSTVLSLLFATGANTANTIAPAIGFTVADKTLAVTYTSNNAQSYSEPYTPSYDAADAIVVKGAELYIGTELDNINICAQSVKLSIAKTVEDVDCIASSSGILEKTATARTAELTVTAALKKHDVALLDALLKNSGISAMMNCGPKTGGNYVPGKCFNLYLQSCTVSSYTTAGDSFVQANLTLSGYVTSTTKDIFLGFV